MEGSGRLQAGPENVPEIIPTMREVTRIVAGLGGILGRKGDGEPGVKSLWVGLESLDTISRLGSRSDPREIPARRRPPPCPETSDMGQGKGRAGGLPIGLVSGGATGLILPIPHRA